LFAQTARGGVRVRLLTDAVGSRDLLLSSAFADFRKAGGEARFYNPLSLGKAFAPSRWLPPSPGKTLLIDGEVGYTGSACINESMAGWHDLQARFAGPLVRDAERDFERLWDAAEGGRTLPAPGIQPPPASGGLSYVISQWDRYPN